MYTKCYARAFSDIIRNRLWQTKEGLSKVLPPYECIACINTLCVCRCRCALSVQSEDMELQTSKRSKNYIIIIHECVCCMVWYAVHIFMRIKEGKYNMLEHLPSPSLCELLPMQKYSL